MILLIDSEKKDYNLKVSAKDFSLSKWGDYFAPFINFKSGNANADITIKTDDISLNIKGISENMPFEVNGKVFKDRYINCKIFKR